MTENQHPRSDPLGSVAWPVRTTRLLLRRAEPRDAEATWTFRQLPEFARWQSGAPADLATYAAQFTQPRSLAKTLLVELDGTVIGDLMIFFSTTLPAWGNRATNLVVATLYVPFSVYNADGEPFSYAFFYGLCIGLEVLLLAFILRAAWTWPRAARATAGRDLAQVRV